MLQKKISLPANIHVGASALSAFNTFINRSKYKQFFVLCDGNTLRHCLPLLVSNCPAIQAADVFEIESGESSKCIEVANQIWQCLIDQQAGKQTLIINLGGGVVTDLGGFCASVYKRGIDYINVPTSLLAMIDASVGSKTGINFKGIKNIIGSFYGPKAIFIDPIFLITLQNREIKNGLAEVVKMALIGDKSLWHILNNTNTLLNDDFIKHALAIKCKLVAKDPYDNGVRQALNYGHSIAHAIEALFANKIPAILHGEAVVIGMIIENHVSYQLKMIDKALMLTINQYLIQNFKPQTLSNKHTEACLSFLYHDKKNTQAQLKFSLLNKIGDCKIQVPVKPNQVSKALQYYANTVK